MIFDELVKTTSSLKSLKQKTDLKNNKALQDNTDARYRIVLSQTKSFVDVIEYLYTEISIERNDEILETLSNLLQNLENAVQDGLASQNVVSDAETSFKTLQTSMKKDWSKQYSNLTGATISTLEAVKGIDPDNVTACLNKIQGAEEWEPVLSQFQLMTKGVQEADQLILRLGLDTEIIQFLQSTNSGRATLKNLNDKVLEWLRNENLEGKIRISFVKK